MIERLKGLMRLTLMRNILALYGVRITNQLLPLALIPYLARVLEPTGWGLVVFAQTFAMYGIIAVEYGFELAGPRAVAQGRDQVGRLAQLISGVLATQLMIAVVVGATAAVIHLLVPEFRDNPALLWAALAFAVVQGFNPIWYFTGQERLPLIASIDACGKILATVSIFVVVQAPDDGWKVLAAHAAAAGLTTTVGYALVVREVRPGRPSLGLIWRTLQLGFSMFVMRMAVMMHTAGNAFLLGLLAAPHHVAFFAAGEKLCRPAAWLLQPINIALLPRLSQLVGHSPDQARQMASIAVLLMGAVGIAFGVSLALVAPWLVPLLFGPGYDSAVPILQIMAFIVPLIVLNSALVSQWMVPHGLDRALNAVIISGTVLNFVLALSLVPRFHALGMAWVTLAIESYILIGLLFMLRRNGLRPIQLSLLRAGVARLAAARR